MEMDFNSILNVPLQSQAIWKEDVPLIGMSSVPQVRVDVIGHTHFYAIQE